VDEPVEYPAIRAFVRGYLHQDAAAEYGSARAAAQQFYRDADPSQIHELRREWSHFRRRHISLSDINRSLQQLGGAWLFHTMGEFDQMLDATPGPTSLPGGKK
jgi:hypothetical protein